MSERRGGDDRKTRKQKKRGATGKPLGRMALTAIAKNDEFVEDWIDDLAADGKTEGTDMARVVKQFGLEFDVDVYGVGIRRATLRGLFASKGAFKAPDATTKVHPGGWVIVSDLGLGDMSRGTSMQIVGIMNPEQAHRAKRYLHIPGSGAKSSSGSNVFEFDREMANMEERARHEAEIAARRRNLASLRRGHTLRRSSSGKEAWSSETSVSSEPNWAKLSEERKAEAKRAKLTRRKDRRRAKKAAAGGAGGGGGSAWAWFRF